MTDSKEDLFVKADTLLFKDKNFSQAETIYRQILEQDPNCIDAINSLAYCLKFAAKTVDSPLLMKLFELYEKSLQLDAQDVEANFNLGLLQMQYAGDYSKALMYFKAAVSKKETHGGLSSEELFRSQFAKAYFNMAVLNDQMKQLNEAQKCYEKTIQICENDPENKLQKSMTLQKANANLAVVLEKVGQREAAHQTLLKLKSANFKESRVYNNLGIIERRLGDLRAAVDTYKQAIKMDPQNFYPVYNLALLLKQLRDNQCVDYLLQAYQLADKDTLKVSVLLHLAIHFETNNDEIDKAIQYYEQALAIEPTNTQIELKIKQLKEQALANKEREEQEKAKIAAQMPISGRNATINQTKSINAPGIDDETASKLDEQTAEVQPPEPEQADSPRDSAINSARPIEKSEKYKGWLMWPRDVATEKQNSLDPEEAKRALFRLGQIEQDEDNSLLSLKYFRQLQQMDKEFCADIVNLRIAEVCYKLGEIENALVALDDCEPVIKDVDRYMIHLLRGKCFDRQREFHKAVNEYKLAIQACVGLSIDGSIRGNLEFRLGWSMIRCKSNEDIEQGVLHLEQAAKLLPDNLEVLTKLASAILLDIPELNQFYPLCQTSLERVLRLDPSHSEANFLYGKLLYKQDLPEKAIKYLNKSIQLQAQKQQEDQPLKAEVFFYLGLSYEKVKDFKQAMLSLKKCLTLDNNNFSACIKLADLLVNLGEGQRAAKYYKHALKIEPNSIAGHFGLGKAIQQFSDDRDAPIPHYDEVLKRAPNHYRTLTQLGILYLDREEFEKSADFLKKALIANKQYPLALISMGNLLFETGNAEQAIRYHLQALKISGNELQALIGLGNAYYDTGAPETAVAYYKRALTIDPSLSDVHYNLGNALYLGEKIQLAIDHYKKAIQLNPSKAESYYNLGNALCVQAEYDQAIKAYQTAIELEPVNAPALYNLGNALYMQEKFQPSVESYLKALKINNKSPECHFNLASAYNDLGEFKNAAKHYTECARMDQSNVDAFVCLGVISEQLQEWQESKDAFEKALSLDQGNVKALEGLARLKAMQ